MKMELDAESQRMFLGKPSNARKYNKTLAPEPVDRGGKEWFWISEFNRWLKIYSFKHQGL